MARLIGCISGICIGLLMLLVTPPEQHEFQPTAEQEAEYRAERELKIEKQLKYIGFWENKKAEVNRWWRGENPNWRITLYSRNNNWTKPITVQECYSGNYQHQILWTLDYYDERIRYAKDDIRKLSREMP